MLVCRKCGTSNVDGSTFCRGCGIDFGRPVAQVPNMAASAEEPGKGFAVASLVLGIVSFFFFSVICGPLSIIFGGIAKSKGSRSPMATAGMICGIVSVALGVLALVLFGSLLSLI